MCRSRRELSNAYLLAKIGVDTAENEPLEVWGGNSIQYSLHSLFSSVLKPIERAAADLAVDREGVGLVRDREVVQLAAAEKPRGAAGGANLCASLCSPNVVRAFVLATDRLQKSVFGSLLDLYVHR